MSTPLQIAIAQSFIHSDVRENGARIRSLMEEAANKGARLIHFPEGALSGYVKAQIKDWSHVDWDAIAEELTLIRKAAKQFRIWTVVGCNHRLTAPNRPQNSLYIVSDEGEVVNRYDKRWCSNSEITDWYSPGDLPCVFEVDGFKFGCALCIEIQFPVLFSEYEALDVDCVLFSTYSEDPMFWTQAQGHAATNNYWLSFSVPAQCSANLQSGMINPDGNGQSRAQMSAEDQMLIAQLDYEDPGLQVALTKARPWRRKARSGEIYQDKPKNDPRSLDKLSY